MHVYLKYHSVSKNKKFELKTLQFPSFNQTSSMTISLILMASSLGTGCARSL